MGVGAVMTNIEWKQHCRKTSEC